LADSPNLLPLGQAPSPSLAGYVAAYYLPLADLLAEPVLASPGLVSRDLVLAAGAGWRALPYTPNTLKFEETPKLERGVTTYQVRATAQRPQPTPAVLAALTLLDRRPLLLLLVEAGGGRRLVGSLEEYLLLATTGEAQNPSTKAGVELRLEGQTSRRAPYYEGQVPVLTAAGAGQAGSYLPPVDSPGGPAGYVTIVDKKGNLMARVPAGTTVTVASGFRVVLSF